ncbi:MAG: hypothetical protein U0934_14735 [Pseudotabrizicola sp.]|uniref:hypothetical protein n=1 Tax=Pseudotabrizicola sp. TaxID=2939647 RepID=UPI002727A684|nr:hypothetical protein [Pseudotabrizicola sp.]MDO8882410.1 hypothetical protein [Pseudotabrizicola sp.]MDP2082269.1 hypothetical protein [Pseudotabrizicola sp.]MDZ7575189.1 hypothetical protein [Pseudotabrizicola sp.]
MNAPTADITIHAAYASVVEDDEDGMLFIGFAQGEEEDEPYALFRQPISGGPVWFAVNDEDFGADDAVQSITLDAKGLTVTIRPEHVASFGWAGVVAIRIGPHTEDAEQAITALHDVFGEIFPH